MNDCACTAKVMPGCKSQIPPTTDHEWKCKKDRWWFVVEGALVTSLVPKELRTDIRK